MFSLFVVYKWVVLAQNHIDFALHGFALFNALALAKVMLVAQNLHLADQFRDNRQLQRSKIERVRLTVRKAEVDPKLRATFERLGAQTMQQLLAVGGTFRQDGVTKFTEGLPDNPPLLAWRTEQHDIQERKETISFVMEVAIVVLVGAELFFSIGNFPSSH